MATMHGITQSLYYQLNNHSFHFTYFLFFFVVIGLSKSNKIPGAFMNEQVKLKNEHIAYKLMNTCFRLGEKG